MLETAVILLICSSIPDATTNKIPLCDEQHFIRKITMSPTDVGNPDIKYSAMQLCFLWQQQGASSDGASTLGEGQYMKVICHLGGADPKPETEK